MKKKHFCPICQVELKVNMRYLDYICWECVLKATDKKGRTIGFYTVDWPEKQKALGSDIQEFYDGNTCYIEGVECYAKEAYYGGIVVVPKEFKQRNG